MVQMCFVSTTFVDYLIIWFWIEPYDDKIHQTQLWSLTLKKPFLSVLLVIIFLTLQIRK